MVASTHGRLARIKYVSRFTRDMTPTAIDALVSHAQSSNASRGITGIIITTGRLFYQIIEGPEVEVRALYARISDDERHAEVLVLGEELTDHRLFPDWAMRKLELGATVDDRLEPLREILSTVLELRTRADRLTNTLERGILRELIGG